MVSSEPWGHTLSSKWNFVALYAKKRKHRSQAAAGLYSVLTIYLSGALVQSIWNSDRPGCGSGSAKNDLNSPLGAHQPGSVSRVCGF